MPSAPSSELVLASAALTCWVSPWWLLMTVFIGLNLFQSAFTHFCGLSLILAKCGLPKGNE